MTKSDRLVIRLEPDARARLKAKASALGLDEAAFARMLIYREVNEITAAPQPPTREPRAVRGVATSRQPQASRPHRAATHAAEVFAAASDVVDEMPADEPRAEEMEIAADVDDDAGYEAAAAQDAGAGDAAAVEALMTAGPSMLDEMLARLAPRASDPAPLMSTQRGRQQGYRAPLSRRQGVMPQYGPGSRTRPVGINDDMVGTNQMGDGRGNVLRDNMRHFGINGRR